MRRGVAAIGMVVACGFLLSYDVAVRPVASSAERTQIYGHASCDFGQSGSAIVDWIPPFDPPSTLQPPESALDIVWQQTGGAPAPDQLQLLALGPNQARYAVYTDSGQVATLITVVKSSPTTWITNGWTDCSLTPPDPDAPPAPVTAEGAR